MNEQQATHTSVFDRLFEPDYVSEAKPLTEQKQ